MRNTASMAQAGPSRWPAFSWAPSMASPRCAKRLTWARSYMRFTSIIHTPLGGSRAATLQLRRLDQFGWR